MVLHVDLFQISLHLLVAHLLSSPAAQAAVIDTTGGFDVLRLYQVIISRLQSRKAAERAQHFANPNPQIFGPSAPKEDTEQLAEGALDRVKVMRVFDFVGVSEAINELRDDFSVAASNDNVSPERELEVQQRNHVADSEGEDGDDEMLFDQEKPDNGVGMELTSRKAGEIGLIIIDNITHTLNPILKSNYVQGKGIHWMTATRTQLTRLGQSLLMSFLRSLTHLTRTENLAAIIINNASAGRPTYPTTRNTSNLPPSTYIPDPTFRTPFFMDQPSIFASTTSRPAMGKAFTYAIDVHILLSQLPKRRRDAEIIFGGKLGNQEMANVMEILTDRRDRRAGRWGAFTVVNGVELRNAV